jgi:hypothetical protein
VGKARAASAKLAVPLSRVCYFTSVPTALKGASVYLRWQQRTSSPKDASHRSRHGRIVDSATPLQRCDRRGTSQTTWTGSTSLIYSGFLAAPPATPVPPMSDPIARPQQPFAIHIVPGSIAEFPICSNLWNSKIRHVASNRCLTVTNSTSLTCSDRAIREVLGIYIWYGMMDFKSYQISWTR